MWDKEMLLKNLLPGQIFNLKANSKGSCSSQYNKQRNQAIRRNLKRVYLELGGSADDDDDDDGDDDAKQPKDSKLPPPSSLVNFDTDLV